MDNKEILEKNGGKKFDVVLMNPPYGAKEDGNYMDVKFSLKCMEIANKQITIMPAKFSSTAKIYDNFWNLKHIKEIDLYDPNTVFNIASQGTYKYVGVYFIDSLNKYDKFKISVKDKKMNTIFDKTINNTYEERNKFVEEDEYGIDFINIIKKFENIRENLFEKYKTMVNDNHGFIYEENRLQRGKIKFGVSKKDQEKLSRVKEYLKTGKFKYCIYKNSAGFGYTKPKEWNGEDPDKIFKGQICWLTNNKTVKNNLKYWMECPLFDMWRYYYFNRSKYSVGCMFGRIPALDFEMEEDNFKEYVDSLNNFSEEEIKILKDNNIHNADKL